MFGVKRLDTYQGRIRLLNRYLAQVADAVTDAARTEKYRKTIRSVLHDAGIRDPDCEVRLDAIMDATTELLSYTIDMTLELAQIAYREVHDAPPDPQ